MNWAWTHNLLHGCPDTYPLHHSDQLMLEVEETNHNEEIVNFNKEALISIRSGESYDAEDDLLILKE